MQIFKFQRRTCKLSFVFPPRRQSTPESLLEDHVRHGDSDNENENGSENEVNDLTKTKQDIPPQTCEILRTFVWWSASLWEQYIYPHCHWHWYVGGQVSGSSISALVGQS